MLRWFFVGVALVATRLAARSGTGTVEGRVSSGATGNYLNNARVVVTGTNLETFTNEIGEYRLTNVSAGMATLRATF